MSETFEPAQPQPKPKRSSILTARNVLYIGVVVVALIVVAVQQIIGALAQPVYIVNGIDRQISVTVDGAEHAIPAYESVQVAVSDMPFTVGVNSKFLDNEEVVVDVESSFMTRLLNPQTIVVDPTEIAVLVWQRFPYIEEGKTYTDEELEQYYDLEVYFGESSYALDKVDFELEVAPENIDNVVNISVKTELTNQSDYAPDDILYYLLERVGEEVLEDYITRRFRYERPTLANLAALYDWTEDSTFMNAARPRVGNFGDDVELHRQYQAAATLAVGEGALRADYEALLAENPDNAMWHYLMGRLLDNTPEARAHWERALELDPNYGHAHLGLAYLALQLGDAELGVAHAERAYSIDPKSDLFMGSLSGASLFRRDYTRAAQIAAKLYESNEPRNEIDLEAMDYQAQALTRSGNGARMRERIDEIFNWIESDMSAAGQDDPTETAEYVRDYLLQTVEYIESDGENLAALSDIFDNDYYEIEHHLLAGNFGALPSFEEGLERESWKYQLMFAIGKQLHGRDDASRHFSEAAKLMREYGGDYGEYANLIDGARAYDPKYALELALDPPDRALVFAALIAYDERYRVDLADIVRTLNLTGTVPEYLIGRVVDAPAE